LLEFSTCEGAGIEPTVAGDEYAHHMNITAITATTKKRMSRNFDIIEMVLCTRRKRLSRI